MALAPRARFGWKTFEILCHRACQPTDQGRQEGREEGCRSRRRRFEEVNRRQPRAPGGCGARRNARPAGRFHSVQGAKFASAAARQLNAPGRHLHPHAVAQRPARGQRQGSPSPAHRRAGDTSAPRPPDSRHHSRAPAPGRPPTPANPPSPGAARPASWPAPPPAAPIAAGRRARPPTASPMPALRAGPRMACQRSPGPVRHRLAVRAPQALHPGRLPALPEQEQAQRQRSHVHQGPQRAQRPDQPVPAQPGCPRWPRRHGTCQRIGQQARLRGRPRPAEPGWPPAGGRRAGAPHMARQCGVPARPISTALKIAGHERESMTAGLRPVR
jgi:hypothetical protein